MGGAWYSNDHAWLTARCLRVDSSPESGLFKLRVANPGVWWYSGATLARSTFIWLAFVSFTGVGFVQSDIFWFTGLAFSCQCGEILICRLFCLQICVTTRWRYLTTSFNVNIALLRVRTSRHVTCSGIRFELLARYKQRRFTGFRCTFDVSADSGFSLQCCKHTPHTDAGLIMVLKLPRGERATIHTPFVNVCVCHELRSRPEELHPSDRCLSLHLSNSIKIVVYRTSNPRLDLNSLLFKLARVSVPVCDFFSPPFRDPNFERLHALLSYLTFLSLVFFFW